jgi:quercetin dioxygenase-like cupin family protein
MLNPGQSPQPFAVDYEQAPAYWSIGILWNVLISAERSFGQFTLMDQTMPRGAGPPAHMHERMAEGFYILDGEIRYEVGAEKAITIGRPGTAVWIPPGTPHAFKVTSQTARALNFYTPGGFDDQFSFLAAPAAEKILPPPDAAGAPDAERRGAYLERLRNLHQETGLTDQEIW